ncbi:MAG TPA: CpsB/CapC family capsule biosynthesis tyrosine phosphatase [Blastocatellia bacterium]|jgi:protein-tyrosine phosphatase|nr:CpsB/CapC family capsule biosynthesis tyrosine phosphatase [Blastocatellia bacterium]
MIDIHSHILAEVDDGARSLEESLDMCRRSAEDGVFVMVATPHAHDSVHTTHNPEFLQAKVDELNQLLNGSPRIELGCELRFTHDVVRQVCKLKSAPTLAGGPYVLVEFPHRLVPPGTTHALFELMSNQIRPIIAHPERNEMLIAEPGRFFELVEMGALGQADTGSFTGQFGRRVQEAATVMLENGMLHIIASDCHNVRNRLPGMSSAVASVAELVGDELATAMSKDNPAAVVRGEPIPFRPIATAPKKRKKWLFF